MAKIIITGVRGQDGSLLAERLIGKGHEVVGLTRDAALRKGRHFAGEMNALVLRHCTYDEMAIYKLIEQEKPDAIYNFAGQAYVGKSWLMLDETLRSAAEIPQTFLEAIRSINPKIRYFQASSSQIYAASQDQLRETSAIQPATPYGCSKAYSHFLVGCYRETYGLHAVNGILFNHESPRRDDDFFAQKVVRGVIDIVRGEQQKLKLGNLNIERDMGCAREFVEAAERILEAETPNDYNICTGKAVNLRELVDYVFKHFGLSSDDHIEINDSLVRRYEPGRIWGSNEKLRTDLNWAPSRSIFNVFDEMIAAELKRRESK